MRLADDYNAKRKLVRYQPGDVVWLENMHRPHKFTPRWMGPFRVSEEVHPGTYKIYDAKGNVHGSPVTAEHLKRAVFDVERDVDVPLGAVPSPDSDSASSSPSAAPPAAVERLTSSSIPLAPPADASASRRVLTPRPFSAGVLSGQASSDQSLADSFEVEDITDRKILRGKIFYQVRWTGFDSSSWEPVENLEGCAALLDAYDRAHAPPTDSLLLDQRVGPAKLRSRFQEVVSASSSSALPSSSPSTASDGVASSATPSAASAASSAVPSPSLSLLRRSARLQSRHLPKP